MTACLHPGGLALTERLLRMAALPPGARILDIGCGEGTTVAYLQQAGYDASGIDLHEAAQSCIITGELRRPSISCRIENPGGEAAPCAGDMGGGEENRRAEQEAAAVEEKHTNGGPAALQSCLIRGDMRSLPFENESFDAVLAECSLSACGDRDAALSESMRVLRPGGAILASDLFFPETDGPGAEACAEAFARAEFTGIRLEDASSSVQEFFLQFIWEHGCLPDAWKRICAGRKKIGYFLIYGRK